MQITTLQIANKSVPFIFMSEFPFIAYQTIVFVSLGSRENFTTSHHKNALKTKFAESNEIQPEEYTVLF